MPIYGTHVQYQTDEPALPVLPKQEITKIQQVVGSLLYNAKAVDPTLLVALVSIASEQNKVTQKTAKAITKILNYVATHPLAITKYNASPMNLHIHSDASYLSEKKLEVVPEVISFYLITNLPPQMDRSILSVIYFEMLWPQ